MHDSAFVVITGPSAAGKTALTEALLLSLPSAVRLVTTTTRAPRPHEVHGTDYQFTSREDFLRRRDANEFFEWAEIYGNLYGNSRLDLARLRENYRFVFAVLDVQGARTVKKAVPESVVVFIHPGSTDAVRRRLLTRKGITEEELARRIGEAAAEMGAAAEFDDMVTNRDWEFLAALTELERAINPFTPTGAYW